MSGATAVRPFDLGGPLPTGVTVLEASAGTGKTYALAGLAVRFVAEGVPLDELLLVTFTRLATGELRDRVRARFVAVERDLATFQATGQVSGDEVVAVLARGEADEVAERRARLRRALADFDAATIATIHSFCQDMLGELGIGVGSDPDVEFVEETDDLVSEAVDDLYVRRFHGPGRPDPPFDRACALRIGRAAVEKFDALIVPDDAAADSEEGMRVRLAEAVRGEVTRRKERARVQTYDDLLTRLRAVLTGPQGAVAAERLRERYRVVLVDEFQDTDLVQWDIFQRAFAQGGALVLIGDPKQAIYGFRGADVYSYLAAARDHERLTLDVNWRSDEAYIRALDALFGGVRLGEKEIPYRTVQAPTQHRERRLVGDGAGEPLRIRAVPCDSAVVRLTKKGAVVVDSAREHIACDVARQAVDLLESGARIEERGADGGVLEQREVSPSDLAVLVRTRRTAQGILAALSGAGVPAVMAGSGSVLLTPAGDGWLRLLEALERPADGWRARRAALGPFLGWDAARIALAGEEEVESLHERLHRWADVLRLRGVAALFELIVAAEGLPGRLLARTDGERLFTDLRHVAQLLHAAARSEQLGPAALTAWLRHRIAEESETGEEERSRRLESDAQAVQVLTIHSAKGLEYPVVLLPDLWEEPWLRKSEPPVFHQEGRRVLDVGGAQAPGADERWSRFVEEQRGEDLRLAYVALTRARHQSIVWWAGAAYVVRSPLGRLLFARDEEGNVAVEAPAWPAHDALLARLGEVAAAAPGCVGVEVTGPAGEVRWAPAARPDAPLGVAVFDRELDRGWRRTSYSDITARAWDPQVASEPEEGVEEDELASADPDAPPPADDPLAGLPGGVDAGTLVHRVLEAADFTAPEELEPLVREHLARSRLAVDDPVGVARGLEVALGTPLGDLVGDLRLCDVGRSDRLDELAFELPLAGGDVPTGRVTMDGIAAVLRRELAEGDPLRAYADRLSHAALRRAVRGYLTGSLDLVLRLGDGRFAVLDYKTTRLHGDDYGPDSLAADMRHAHYGLQALLYVVALHRFLRWRVRDYDPEVHLAGVLYLFLRGMRGPATPRVEGTPHGVFAWRPPARLVTALSDVLDGGA